MKKITSVLLLLVLLFSLCACQGTSVDGTGGEKLQIMAAMFAEYDFASQVAGDCAEVKLLLPPGADMHSYEPTPQNIIDIESADVFVYGGGESDVWLDDVLDSVGESITTVKMMDACELFHEEENAGESHGHDEEEYDEHVWTSPKNAIKIVDAIAKTLCDADKENADLYRQNADEYISKLEELDADFRQVISDSKRHEIVFADRFPLLYFAEEYDLEHFAAFPGCSHDTEASAATVREIIDKVREDNIPVVFKIEMSNDALAETVSNETGAQVLEFHSCHSIGKDDFKNGETYISLMRKNLENLTVALN